MIKNILSQFITTQEGRLNLFLPVCFACGIAVYFCLPAEPSILISLLSALICLGFFIYLKTNIRLLFLFLLFFFAGWFRINLQTAIVDAPFIHKKYNHVNIVGTVEKSEIQRNAQRLTLSHLNLDQIPADSRPVKIRIRTNNNNVIFHKGDTITFKATLMPPALPFYPNGYPYSRTAFYQQIGATGYVTDKIQVLHHNPSEESYIENIRSSIRKHITKILPTEQASVATALVTGDQSLVSLQQREDYTAAGIVHILSVSGFHMALIASFVFFLFRLIFLLLHRFFQNYNTKKICAFFALIATLMYLLVSGMAVPAMRAFGMIVLVLIGIIYDRRAVSLHSVFWVGFILLLIFPESLITASFALSFTAVIALVACHEMFYPHLQKYFATKSKFTYYIVFPFIVILLINFIAHIATTPISIYHFHRYANYTIFGNLLITPLFSFLIMPLLFCATLCIPLGLSYPLFWIVGHLLSIVNFICRWIASFPYASVYLPSFPLWGYASFLTGGILLFVLKGRIRLYGLLFICIGCFSPLFFTHPDIIINQGGSFWSVRNTQEFDFSSVKKYKSTRYAWLEAMGYNPYINVETNDSPVRIIKGLKIRFDGYIDDDADIVFNTKSNVKCPHKLCISRQKLWKEGSHAIYINNKHVKIVTAAQYIHRRPWSQGFFSQLK